MPEDPIHPNHTLTVVVEADGELDRESETFRRLLAARLQLESLYGIRLVEGELTTAGVRVLCGELASDYVVFVRSSHLVSRNFVTTLVTHLKQRRLYLAEPVTYTSDVPDDVSKTPIADGYHYDRDSDIYGVAFNRARMLDALEAIGDLDRTALYLGYRLSWSIDRVKPLTTGYSVAVDAKGVIGIPTPAGCSRLVPTIPTTSPELRLMLLRYLVVWPRGLRRTGAAAVSLTHLQAVVQTYALHKLTSSASMQPFEADWIRWLHDPESDDHLFKKFTDRDAYLVFRRDTGVDAADVELYRLTLADTTLTIVKQYRAHAERPGYSDPSVYDFYRRPITRKSTMLFFDRPLQADDNAEHLYDAFLRRHPEYTEAYFALNPRSPDWPRLKVRGFKLIHMFSKEFYAKYLESDLVVPSQVYNLRHQGKTLANSRFVYLQHGVPLNDMTDWVLSKHFDIFVATGRDEAEYLARTAPVETLNSGLPRLELLRCDSSARGRLFLMRPGFNLHHASTEHFQRSEYFRALDGILTDRRLLDHLERTDRTLHVKLHPNVETRAADFSFSKRVIHSDLSYSEAISSAEMVFTDYSSVVLEAAFIGTPIAYYQWDAPHFFAEQPYGNLRRFQRRQHRDPLRAVLPEGAPAHRCTADEPALLLHEAALQAQPLCDAPVPAGAAAARAAARVLRATPSHRLLLHEPRRALERVADRIHTRCPRPHEVPRRRRAR